MFSVVIPAKNEEKFLTACVESIQKQQGSFCLEIIVVNNGSTDKTGEIARELGLKVIDEPIAGVGKARKAGTEAANNEFIVHVDADSRLPENYLVRVLEIFQRERDIVCLGGKELFYDGSWWQNLLRPIVFYLLYFYARVVSGKTIGPMGNNMIFRKSDYYKTTGFDENINFGEDADLSRKLSKYGQVKIDSNLCCFVSARRYGGNHGLFKQLKAFLMLCHNKKPAKG